jgi:hypothetical protein
MAHVRCEYQAGEARSEVDVSILTWRKAKRRTVLWEFSTWDKAEVG